MPQESSPTNVFDLTVAAESAVQNAASGRSIDHGAAYAAEVALSRGLTAGGSPRLASMHAFKASQHLAAATALRAAGK